MSTLLAIGLANATCAALLAVPALLASRHGRRPALAHALWLLVLLKLVTPPLFRPPLAWLPAEAQPAPAAAAPAPRAEAAAPAVPLMLTLEMPTQAAVPAALAAPLEGPTKAMIVTRIEKLVATPPPEAAPPPADAAPAPAEPAPPADAHDPARSALALLVALWLAGAALWLGRSMLYVARFRRLVLRHARPAGDPVQQQAHDLAARLGLRRSPPVWLIPGAVPPMVWGLGRPVILFPAGLLEHLGPDERASLLLHELAHVRRRDHWVRWLELAALCLFWWYPLAWWARGRMLQHEEECCDAWAAAESSPRAYAAAILDAVDFLAGARPRLPAVASPLAGAASLKQRLTLILTATPPRQLGGLARLGLFALAVAVLPLVPTLARSDKPAATEAPAQAERPELPEPTELKPNPVELLASRDAFSVQFSRDGQFLAVGLGEFQRPGEVQLFDVPTRKPVWRVGEAHGIASVSFTADSQHLAWSGWGGQLRGRDVAGPGGRLALPVPGRNFRLAHSADGKWLAAAGEDRLLQLREPKTGQFRHALRGDLTDFYCVTFSPDSQLLAAGGGYFEREKDNFAVLFDVASRRQVARLEGHTRAVLNVAFAPKRDLIATSSYDTTVRLWDGKTFRPKTVLRGHTGGVKGLAFSPDGKTLATGSFDRTVRLWDVAAGQELARLEGHPLRVRELAFSPDGRTLASVGGGEAVKLWDVKGRRLLTTLRQAPAQAPAAPVAMALSADGKALALGTDNGRVVVRDPRTAEVRLTIKAHDDAVTSLSFSRDGQHLASGGPDAVVKVWATADGKLVRAFKGHTSWVYALAFAGDGRSLASGSYDRTVRVWPLGPGPEKVLTGHKASVRALAFTGDGKGLISGGADRTIRVWDLEKSASQAILKGHEGAVRGLALAEGGKVLLSAGEDGLIKRWDLVRHVELASVKATAEGAIRTVSLSPAGRVLAAGNDGGSLMLYDPARLALYNARAGVHPTGGVVHLAFAPGGQQLFSLGGGGAVKRFEGQPSPVRLFNGHKGPVRTAVFSPDGKLALSCGGWPEGDKTLRLWEVATGQPLRTFAGNQQQLQSAAFTPDGRHVAAGEDGGVIHLWEAATGKPVRQFKGHGAGAIPQLSFSPDGKRLLSASHDRTARLWDVATGEQKQVFKGHTDWARTAIFLPGGQRVLTGGRDKTVRVWRIADGALLRTITQPDVVEAVAATRDGKRLLAGGGNFVRLYNADTGGLLSLFSGHTYGVTSLALAKDDRTALSSSYDGSVRAWDLETGAQAYRLGSHREWVWSVALSPDGRHALTAGGGGQQGGKFVPGSDFAIRLWRLPAVTAVALGR